MSEKTVQASVLRAKALSMRTILPYSSGQIVDTTIGNALGTFLMFYITAVCGLSPGLAGLALGAGLVVDAASDPFIGSASDAFHSRLGRRLPFMLVGLPLTATAFTLMFAIPQGMNENALFVSVMALSILLRVSGSLFNLPYQAVSAELTDDDGGRASLMAWKFAVGTVGGILAIVVGFGLFFSGKDGLSRHAAYLPYAISMSLLIVAAGAVACWSVFTTRERQHPPMVAAGRFHHRFASELLELARNRSFLALFASSVLFFSGLGVAGTLSVHMGTFFWRLNSAQMQAWNMGVPVGIILGIPIAATILKFTEKRTAIGVGMAFLGIAVAMAPVLRACGLLPLNGTPLTVLLTGIYLMTGMVAALAAVAIAAMLADAVDEHEFLFGARREGLFFSAWAFASKAASGVGALVAGLVLEVIHFPSGVTKLEQAHELSEHTISMLGLLAGPAPGLMFVGAAIGCVLYRLDSRKHAAILEKLRERRRREETARRLPDVGYSDELPEN